MLLVRVSPTHSLQILREELASEIHALAIKTATPEKWIAAGKELRLDTPKCLGGSKHDPLVKRK